MNLVEEATSEDLQDLWAKIKSITFAMLTSEDDGTLRSRPMAASQTEFDGTLWFFTHASAHKVTEVDRDQRVNVSYADPDNQIYVSLSGTAHVDRSRASIEAHWSKAVEPWFPQGKNDPDIALLRVDVHAAEYWDAPSSTIVRAWENAKAMITRVPPKMGENVKLSL